MDKLTKEILMHLLNESNEKQTWLHRKLDKDCNLCKDTQFLICKLKLHLCKKK